MLIQVAISYTNNQRLLQYKSRLIKYGISIYKDTMIVKLSN